MFDINNPENKAGLDLIKSIIALAPTDRVQEETARLVEVMSEDISVFEVKDENGKIYFTIKSKKGSIFKAEGDMDYYKKVVGALISNKKERLQFLKGVTGLMITNANERCHVIYTNLCDSEHSVAKELLDSLINRLTNFDYKVTANPLEKSADILIMPAVGRIDDVKSDDLCIYFVGFEKKTNEVEKQMVKDFKGINNIIIEIEDGGCKAFDFMDSILLKTMWRENVSYITAPKNLAVHRVLQLVQKRFRSVKQFGDV